MKRIIYSIVLFSLLTVSVYGQNAFEEVFRSIENNNTTLKAYREQANADKIGNRTGLNLANPEVGFGYLWGNPRSMGNETDLSISQSFDFPTAYRYKSQLADGKNRQVDLVYDQQRREILQQVRNLCIELVYQNKMNKQLTKRFGEAKQLATAYQRLFDKGEIDILERNKTRLDLLNTEKALQKNEVEIATLKSELQRMNGGLAVSTDLDDYSIYSFPLNFDEWFNRIKDNNPRLKQAEKEVELSRKQEQLTKALNLPKFTAGYSYQHILGTTQQGVTVGVSVPLWEGKNTVKHQKAQTVALQMQREDAKYQFYNTLKNQYDKSLKLSRLLKEYEQALNMTSNRELLKKALDKGQLSLINYLLELSVYYETVDKYLETEQEYQLSVAELQQWEQ